MSNNAASVVIITGGSSGIGRCTAGLFAQRGWRVGLIARGAEVQFDKNAMVDIRFNTRAEPPAEKSPASGTTTSAGHL